MGEADESAFRRSRRQQKCCEAEQAFPSIFADAAPERLPKEGIADKELSALLAGERLVPIVHQTTYEMLREVSPLLASRSGLSTAEESMAKVAAKLAELVKLT